MNAESLLRYPTSFIGEKREVFLEGEAFFEVAKDAKHPFIVVSVSAMLVYIHQKNIAQVFILERYFFVSIYPAAIPCTYLAVFLATALPLCL